MESPKWLSEKFALWNFCGSSDFPLELRPSGKSHDPVNSLGQIFPHNHCRLSTVYTSVQQDQDKLHNTDVSWVQGLYTTVVTPGLWVIYTSSVVVTRGIWVIYTSSVVVTRGIWAPMTEVNTQQNIIRL